MGPLTALLFVAFILSFIFDFLKKASNKGDVKNKNASSFSTNRMNASNADSAKGKYSGAVTSQQREKLEQLRKLQQLRQNAANERAGAEKPLYAHQTTDCSGGSIHDGYHEGSVRRPQQASSAEGRLGKQGVSRSESKAAAKVSYDELIKEQPAYSAVSNGEESAARASLVSGSEKLAKAISGKPAIVQGLIWAEILGKPLSDS